MASNETNGPTNSGETTVTFDDVWEEFVAVVLLDPPDDDRGRALAFYFWDAALKYRTPPQNKTEGNAAAYQHALSTLRRCAEMEDNQHRYHCAVGIRSAIKQLEYEIEKGHRST